MKHNWPEEGTSRIMVRHVSGSERAAYGHKSSASEEERVSCQRGAAEGVSE
jgi:hypothetical protein